MRSHPSRQAIWGTRPSQVVCGGPSHPPSASTTKTVLKPSPAPEITEDALGHWRNRWEVPEKHEHLARRQGALPLGDGTWLGYRRFPTSAEAEDVAQRFASYNFFVFSIKYLGPEFFPEY